MSVVIAVKDKNRIVLGSDKQASTGNGKDHTFTKIWEIPELPGAIMGSVGSARVSQIIQYSWMIDKNSLMTTPTTSYIINSVVPSIMQTLLDSGIKIAADEKSDIPMMSNEFIFAYGDKAWVIGPDFGVIELDEYSVIGSGSEVATGVLYATKNKNPFERIVTCIDAAAETTLFVDNGVDLLATEYKATDKKAIEKALGVKIVTDQSEL